MTLERRQGPQELGRTRVSARGAIIALYLLGGATVIGGVFVARRTWANVPDSVLLAIAGVGFLWMIAAHAVVVVRRESPRFGYPSAIGRRAVVDGILGLIVYGGAEAYVLYALLHDLLGK